MAKNKRPQNQGSDNKNTPRKEEAEFPKQERSIEQEQPAGSFWSNFRLLSTLIMLLSCLLYINTIPHKYAVDDAIVITRNQFTTKGFAGMKGIWGEDTFVGFFGDNKNLVMGGRYRPFSVATFALENQLFGTTIVNKNPFPISAIVKGQEKIIKPGAPIPDKDGDTNYEGNPHVSHFVNLLLYGFLCVLLYWLFLEMFNPQRNKQNLKANFIAFVGALLYAAHPIHTEAVANIKGRDEILVLMGSIMALYWTLKAYNQRDNKKKAIRYHVFAILGFFMGIFSKENAITFVAIIPVALYLFTNAKPAEIALRSLPVLVASLFFWFGVRSIVFVDMNTMDIAREYMNNPFMKVLKNADGTVEYLDMSANEKYGFIFYTWLDYLRLMVLPHPLTNDYYPMHMTYVSATEGTPGLPTTREITESIPSFTNPFTILSVLLHVGMGLAFVWGMMRRHAIAFCIIFYAATFSVISNLFFVIGTTIAERFLFLPSVGFSLACAMGLWALGDRLKGIKIPAIIVLVVTGLYSVKTFIRNFAWQNDQVLFITDIEVSKNSAKLNNAVSGVYQEYLNEPSTQQNPTKRKNYIDKAVYHAERAIEMHPYYNQAWLLYGNAKVYKGDYETDMAKGDTAMLNSAAQSYVESIDHFKFVVQLRFDHPDAIKNMWVSYFKLATLLENRGAEALRVGNNNLAGIYFTSAVQYYDQFLDFLLNVYPKTYNKYNHPDIVPNIGNCYRERGQVLGKRLNQLDMSIESLEKAGPYLPRDSNIPRMLGVANGIKGNHLKAIEYFEKALKIGGENIAIIYNLEVAYNELIKASTAAGVDAATIAGYQERQKFYHDYWFRLNPNYNPNEGQ